MTLQPIKLIDSNKKIKNIGDNVYGYLYAAYLCKVNKYFNPLDLSIVSDEGRQYERNNHFLIKKYSDTKITFEGYVSNETDSLLSQSKNVFNLEIMVYPVPFREFDVVREFDLNDKDLVVRSRFISPEYGYHQWLVDVRKEISAVPMNSSAKDNTEEVFNKDVRREEKKWFSMDNPLIYILTFLVLGFIAYLVFKFDLPLRF